MTQINHYKKNNDSALRLEVGPFGLGAANKIPKCKRMVKDLWS